MGLLSDLNDPRRAARARMEAAERASKRDPQAGGAGDQPRRPQRYRLYDRIAGRVSLNAINIVIAVTSLLLIAALVYGIATGNPQ